MLLSCEFAPGQRISELPLVERLGVSRTPLRLALARLEHEGLLESLPAGGYVMREFTSDDIRDAIELRGILEGTAARYAAERGVPRRKLSTLVGLIEQMDAAVHGSDYSSFEAYVGLNERFHEYLLKLAASPVLTRAFESVNALPFASPSAFVFAEAEVPESREILIVAQSDHRALVDAIERREGGRAENVGREHALLALRNLEIVTKNGAVRARMPGAALLKLDNDASQEESHAV
jgi:GntR family transcriptional regulator of vanillate catabolism